VKELENTLLPRPLFVEAHCCYTTIVQSRGCTRNKLQIKRFIKFIDNVRKYIGDNIQKRIALILEIWELATSSTTLSTRVLHFKEYLQKDLENDESFYKEVVGTFLTKVLSLNDIHRREKNLPSKARLKQINACWLKIIKCL
jgi:hypothetical protein